MVTPANPVNEATTGVVGFTGTTWTATAVTQYDVIVGGASSSTLANVAPSATSGVPLISQGASSNPAFGTAVVAGGGTGNTTFTAYAPICAGTTATGVFQAASTGLSTSGFVLTSNGSSALPSFKAAPVPLLQVTRQVFTSSGTYTPTSGMIYCDVEVIGGGGGGGGCLTTTGYSAGGGGGGGGYARGIFSAASIGVSQSVTIGAAGTGGTAGNTGGTGGTTSVGSLISATGGIGGSPGVSNSAASVALGGVGGAGSNGDFQTNGMPGAPGFIVNISGIGGFSVSGNGGSTFFGGGAVCVLDFGFTNVPGIAATSYGGGGSGSIDNLTAGGSVGGVGFKGIVIVTEYIT